MLYLVFAALSEHVNLGTAALLPFRGGKEKKMAKYRYGFVDGTEEIEISEEWFDLLREMDREELNSNRRETRRHTSLESLDYEGEEFAAEGDAETALLEKESEREAEAMLSSLTEVQRRRVKLRMEGRTYREIAMLENVDARAIEKSVRGAGKKISVFFEKEGPQNAFPMA